MEYPATGLYLELSRTTSIEVRILYNVRVYRALT